MKDRIFKRHLQGVTLVVGAAAFFCLASFGTDVVSHAVTESARAFKVVAEADVVVVGGTSAGVSAAVAAAEAGARVYLVAPRPYLGEDVAGTLSLLPEGISDFDDPAARAIWEGESPRLPFTYRTLSPTFGVHQDDGKLLCDGRLEDAEHDSVQFNDEVAEVLVDLGEESEVSCVNAHTFRNYTIDFRTADCTVSTSLDGKNWSLPVSGWLGRNNCNFNRTVFHIELGARARWLKVAFRRYPKNRRQLVSEITVLGKNRRASRRIPTPREVKSSLDELLIAKSIPYLTGAVVTDVLGDGADGLSGILVANRAGRQLIRARRVIDATARGTALVAAGGRLAPLGVQANLCRFVLSARKPEGKGLTVRALPFTVPTYVQRAARQRAPRNVTARLYACTFTADVLDDRVGTWAAVEDRARALTMNTEEVDAADEVVAPARTVSVMVPGLDYLGATRDYATARAVGRAAARAAKESGMAQRICRRRQLTAADASAVVSERLNGLHGYDEDDLEAVMLEATALPVLGRYDVVVLGGGSAGSAAALGALRGGAKTLVVDYMYNLGGLSTLGMIGYYWFGFQGGFTREIDTGIRSTGYLVQRRGRIDWFRREIRRLEGDIWFGVLGCGVVMSPEDNVVGLVVATPAGRGIVLASRMIDTTGSADVAAWAGEPTEFIDAREFALQTSGPAPIVPGWTYVNTDWSYLHDNDALDYWLNGLRARRGGWGDWDLSQVPSSRERRHLSGGFTVTPIDVALKRTFKDVIAHGRTDFDTHGPTVADICFASEPVGRNVYHLNVPYRSLLPSKVKGLLVASLGLNAHRDAQPFVRMIPDVQNIGYAAGCAAAQSVKRGVPLADVDVRELQKHLVEIGQIPEEALAWTDAVEISDARLAAAVANVANKYHDAPIVFAAPQRALPLLRAAYAQSREPKAKLCYAHILGILRDPTGATTLAEQLAKPKKDRLVINDKGLEAFGLSMTPFESQLVALGRTKSPCAVPVICAAIEKLDNESSLSAVRAVMLACEAMPQREFAPLLARALRKPGLGGNARKGMAAATPRRGFCDYFKTREEAYCPRELHLARALWLCGDSDGVAKQTLEAFAQDPRAVYAAHARAVLKLKK